MESRNDGFRLPPPWISPATGKPNREVQPVITVNRRRPPAGGGQPWTFAQLTTSVWLNGRIPNTFFDAVTGGSNVSSGNAPAAWADAKGNGIRATQSIPERRLIYNATGFNGLGCVTATGGQVMVLPTLPLLTDANAGVIIYTFSLNNDIGYGVVANDSGHWDRFSDGNSYPMLLRTSRLEALPLSMPTNGQHILVYIANPAVPEYIVRHNGVEKYRSTAPFTFSNSIVGIGAGHNIVNAGAGGTALVGSIAEIAVLPGVVALADILRAEGYATHAASMSGVLPANHLYKTTAPTV